MIRLKNGKEREEKNDENQKKVETMTLHDNDKI